MIGCLYFSLYELNSFVSNHLWPQYSGFLLSIYNRLGYPSCTAFVPTTLLILEYGLPV